MKSISKILRLHKTAYTVKGTALLCAAFLMTGCATMPNTAHNGIYDPFEAQNRAVMSFNTAVDKAVINPAIRGYRKITPKFARTGVKNFLRNLNSPAIIVNQLLQGDLQGASTALLRATINTTVGVGGLFDVAGYEGIEYESEDFGQTLAVWGVKPGPYLVAPFIGPSTLRDVGGYIADGALLDPVDWIVNDTDKTELSAARFGLTYLDTREGLMDTFAELEASSFDYYAAVRNIYHQRRAALASDRTTARRAAFPDIPDYE